MRAPRARHSPGHEPAPRLLRTPAGPAGRRRRRARARLRRTGQPALRLRSPKSGAGAPTAETVAGVFENAGYKGFECGGACVGWSDSVGVGWWGLWRGLDPHGRRTSQKMVSKLWETVQRSEVPVGAKEAPQPRVAKQLADGQHPVTCWHWRHWRRKAKTVRIRTSRPLGKGRWQWSGPRRRPFVRDPFGGCRIRYDATTLIGINRHAPSGVVAPAGVGPHTGGGWGLRECRPHMPALALARV